MKCPYTDIGCWHIDDVSHNCEAEKRSDCPHDPQSKQNIKEKEASNGSDND